MNTWLEGNLEMPCCGYYNPQVAVRLTVSINVLGRCLYILLRCVNTVGLTTALPLNITPPTTCEMLNNHGKGPQTDNDQVGLKEG